MWKDLESSCDDIDYKVYSTQRVQTIRIDDWIVKRAVLVNTGSVEFTIDKVDGTASGCFYRTTSGMYVFSFLAFSLFVEDMKKKKKKSDNNIFRTLRKKIRVVRKGLKTLSSQMVVLSNGKYMYRVFGNIDGFLIEIADLQSDIYNSTEFGNHIIGFVDIYNDDRLVAKCFKTVTFDTIMKAFEDMYFIFLCGVDDYVICK